jgi:hypothetical protein
MVTIENLLAKPISVLRKSIFKIELILIFITLLSYFLVKGEIAIGTVILSISMVLLSILYYIMAFRQVADRNKFDDFYLKITGFSLSTSIIGVLFLLQKWPGGRFIFHVALLFILISLLTAFIEKAFLKKGSAFENQDIYRLLITFTILIAINFSVLNTLQFHQTDEEKYEMEEIHKTSEPEAQP